MTNLERHCAARTSSLVGAGYSIQRTLKQDGNFLRGLTDREIDDVVTRTFLGCPDDGKPDCGPNAARPRVECKITGILNRWQGGAHREIKIPASEEVSTLDCLLNAAFHWGQNDFQPVPNLPSLSYGDLIKVEGYGDWDGTYIVKRIGFGVPRVTDAMGVGAEDVADDSATTDLLK